MKLGGIYSAGVAARCKGQSVHQPQVIIIPDPIFGYRAQWPQWSLSHKRQPAVFFGADALLVAIVRHALATL